MGIQITPSILNADFARLGEEVARIGSRRHPRGEVVTAAHLEPLLVERAGVLLAPREHKNVRDRGEMCCEEAADRAGADDADSHANLALRYFRYGSGSSSEPVTRSRSSRGG